MKKYIIFIGIISIFLAGCNIWTEELPDLKNVQWESIYVGYFVKSGSEEEHKSWTSTDRQILDTLQAAFEFNDGVDLWGYTATENEKIDLKLVDGRKYEIHLIRKGDLVINDYEQLKTGFGGDDLNSSFEDALKKIIELETQERVFFYHENNLSCLKK